jgi:hypothetical protein
MAVNCGAVAANYTFYIYVYPDAKPAKFLDIDLSGGTAF